MRGAALLSACYPDTEIAACPVPLSPDPEDANLLGCLVLNLRRIGMYASWRTFMEIGGHRESICALASRERTLGSPVARSHIWQSVCR